MIKPKDYLTERLKEFDKQFQYIQDAVDNYFMENFASAPHGNDLEKVKAFLTESIQQSMEVGRGELDYKQMLAEIDELVETDFAFDMVCHNLPHSKPFTQEEANTMKDIIGRVYSIAHCIHCKACGAKYKLKSLSPKL